MPGEQADPLNPSRKLYTYEGAAKPMEMPREAGVNLEAITAHLERHIGPTDGAFHEIISDQVHIDVVMVPPTEKFPHWTLVTSGMSDRPMKSPAERKTKPYAELLIRLPRDWPVPGRGDQTEWKKEVNYWPVRLLKFIALFPHKYGAFLWVGHTLDNGQPAKPWSPGIPFMGAFLGPSRTLPKEIGNLVVSEEKTIKFMALYPAYLEETALAGKAGGETLWKKFVEGGVTDVVDAGRGNVVSELGRE